MKKKLLTDGFHVVNYFDMFGEQPISGFETWHEEFKVENGMVIGVRQKFKGSFEEVRPFKAEIWEDN